MKTIILLLLSTSVLFGCCDNKNVKYICDNSSKEKMEKIVVECLKSDHSIGYCRNRYDLMKNIFCKKVKIKNDKF